MRVSCLLTAAALSLACDSSSTPAEPNASSSDTASELKVFVGGETFRGHARLDVKDGIELRPEVGVTTEFTLVAALDLAAAVPERDAISLRIADDSDFRGEVLDSGSLQGQLDSTSIYVQQNDGGETWWTNDIEGNAGTFYVDFESGTVRGDFDAIVALRTDVSRTREISGTFSGPLLVSCWVADAPNNRYLDERFESELCRPFANLGQ